MFQTAFKVQKHFGLDIKFTIGSVIYKSIVGEWAFQVDANTTGEQLLAQMKSKYDNLYSMDFALRTQASGMILDFSM